MKLAKETFYIFVVALLFAGLTAGVNSALKPRIELNEETKYSRYLLQAFDIPIPKGASAKQIQNLESENIVKAQIDNRVVYAHMKADTTVEGYAIPISGKGFWGSIYAILAFDESLSKIQGIVFTNHNETPGLGARIEEPWFREQFEGLEMDNAPAKDKYVVISKADAAKKNHVDAITGATMTSSLLQIILNDEIKSILALRKEIRSHKWPSLQKN